MKKNAPLLIILALLLATAVFSCKKDKDEDDKPDSCETFFVDNAMKVNFTGTSITTNFTSEFTKDKAYEVTIFNNGNISVASNTKTYSFTKEMITNCTVGIKTQDIAYSNTETGFELFLKKETDEGSEIFTVRLYNASTVRQASLKYGGVQ